MMAKAIDAFFVCDEAENGLIAVEKYQAAITAGTQYDIIFMDIVMPEMDGKQAVLSIRALEDRLGRERTPIYIMSSSEMLDEIEELVDGLMRKPFSRAVLYETLQKHFDLKME
jgi:CheY-like chemotaxis protein